MIVTNIGREEMYDCIRDILIERERRRREKKKKRTISLSNKNIMLLLFTAYQATRPILPFMRGKERECVYE